MNPELRRELCDEVVKARAECDAVGVRWNNSDILVLLFKCVYLLLRIARHQLADPPSR